MFSEVFKSVSLHWCRSASLPIRAGSGLVALAIHFCLMPCAQAQSTAPVAKMSVYPSGSLVAPAMVHFNYSPSTQVGMTSARDFTELRYDSRFGDPISGLWSTNGGFKNSESSSPIAGHVYGVGDFLARVDLTNSRGRRSSATKSISVADPNFVFSGSKTTCVSASNNFVGCPNGATLVNLTAFSGSTISQYLGATRRVLFRRGDVFNVLSTIKLNNVQMQVGAFGSCTAEPDGSGRCLNDPILQATNTSVFQISDGANPLAKHITIYNLQLIGNNNQDTNGIGFEGTAENVLAYRLVIKKFGNLLMASSGVLQWYGQHTMWKGIAVVDSLLEHAVGNSGYNIFVAGEYLAFLGNRIIDSLNGQHLLRITLAKYMLIAHNVFKDAGLDKHMIKFHAPIYSDQYFGADKRMSRYFSIIRNSFENSSTQFGVTIGPETGDPGYDQRVAIGVVRNNYFKDAGVAPVVSLLVWARNVAIENNVIEPRYRAIEVSRRGSEPGPRMVLVQNNTIVATNGNQISGINLNHQVGKITIINNLVAAGAGSTLLTGSNSFVLSKNNLMTGAPGFVSLSDYHLLASSPAVDAGASCSVLVDIDGNHRGSAPDIGAYER